jgi:helicase, putative
VFVGLGAFFVVITREIKENISHNIFYTTITRAKKYLKIYWSPEIQQYIIKNLISKERI